MVTMSTEKFKLNGLTFLVQHIHDEDAGTPWEREDGHGVVSAWTDRGKKPGERIIATSRNHRRYYDVRESIKIALRDGWGISGDTSKMTKREIASAAVAEDYIRMKAWCEDEWYYLGVAVTLLDVDGNKTNLRDSLWGIESDADDYLDEVARDIAESLSEQVKGDTVCMKVRV